MNRKAPPQQQARRGKAEATPTEEEPLPENGNDTFHAANGATYTGDWKRFDNVLKRHGKGVFSAEQYTYTGDFDQDLFHGLGELKYSDGSCYVGEFEHGKITGTGQMTFADGSIYKGLWRDGRMHGLGTFYTILGEQWTGMWNNGMSHCPIFPQVIPETVEEEEEEEGELEGEMGGEMEEGDENQAMEAEEPVYWEGD